jgi:hypothetical protein
MGIGEKEEVEFWNEEEMQVQVELWKGTPKHQVNR